jgi:hypothetical protein
MNKTKDKTKAVQFILIYRDRSMALVGEESTIEELDMDAIYEEFLSNPELEAKTEVDAIRDSFIYDIPHHRIIILDKINKTVISWAPGVPMLGFYPEAKSTRHGKRPHA